MKKQFLTVMMAVVMGIISPLGLYAAMAEDPGIPAPDEGLVKAFLQKTYATKMIFEGGNPNWSCSYTVRSVIQSSLQEVSPEVNLTIDPKFTWDPYIIRYYRYLLHSSGGCIFKEKWLESGESITLNGNAPVPMASEKIKIQMIRGLNQEEFDLVNTIPANIISPEQALRKTLEVYYKNYGQYPTAKVTFYIDFRDKTYWLVIMDDNDGIGGQGYLLINAFTGEAGDIKVDE